ncbi:MAG: nicotinamide riboside transporter PnuC [Raineya sp.]
MLHWLTHNYVELTGFITSLVCVWLNIRANIWAWFWAIVSSGVSAIFFYHLRLFGDMNLQFFFIATAVYGWYQWRFGRKSTKDGESTKLQISYLPKNYYLPLSTVFLLLFGAVYITLKALKGDILFWDTLTTTLSVLATWLAARKYIENWLLWLVADVIYVVMYLYKGAQLYAILYALFLLMAYIGFRNWQRLQKIEAL